MTSSLMQGDASDSVQLNHWEKGSSGLLVGHLYLPASLFLLCQCNSRVLPRGRRTSCGGGTQRGSMDAQNPPLLCAHPSTHIFLPTLTNHTGLSGRSCEREPCPGQTLQPAVPAPMHESGERRGRFQPRVSAACSIACPMMESLSARGSAGLRMQKCAACLLFSNVI